MIQIAAPESSKFTNSGKAVLSFVGERILEEG
jgi:hypothetical protein